jgi:hypothetical protein
MRFFFDRSVPVGLAKMVRAIDESAHTIVYLDEDPRFTIKSEDTEWLETLGKDLPWIVISGDGRILRYKAEKKSLKKLVCHTFAWRITGTRCISMSRRGNS